MVIKVVSKYHYFALSQGDLIPAIDKECLNKAHFASIKKKSNAMWKTRHPIGARLAS
jgi:hypothetical protein